MSRNDTHDQEQLRYGGVLQVVQVSRAGYPVRINHQEPWIRLSFMMMIVIVTISIKIVMIVIVIVIN